MEVSRRERIIMIAAGVVVGTLLLDRLLLSPFIDEWNRVRAEKQRLSRELEVAANLFERRRHVERRWQEMLNSTLRRDPARAEGQVLHALREWSQKHRLALTSVKPEHARQDEEQLREIRFQVTGTGDMRSAAGFLWELQASPLPLKIKEVQLASAEEGEDRLSLQLRLSTIYVPPREEEEDLTEAAEAQENAQ